MNRYYVLARVRGPEFTGKSHWFVSAASRDAAIKDVRKSLRDKDITITSIITAHRNRRETDV